MRCLSFFCLVVLICAPRVWADTVYTYTGNTYTDVSGVFTTSDRVTGYFETAAPLTPNTTYLSLDDTAFNFSNGYQSLNLLDTTVGFYLVTDNTGNITQWLIDAIDSNDYLNSATTYSLIQTDKGGPYLAADDFATHDPATVSYAETYQDPGTWTVTTTPEPSSLLLLSTGALTAVGTLRRRLRRA